MHSIAGCHFRCTSEDVKLIFCVLTVFMLNVKRHAEISMVELFKSYCLPYIAYACEALPSVISVVVFQFQFQLSF